MTTFRRYLATALHAQLCTPTRPQRPTHWRVSPVTNERTLTGSWISHAGRLSLMAAIVLAVLCSDWTVVGHVTVGFAAVILAAVLAGVASFVDYRLEFDIADLSFCLCLLCISLSACFAVNTAVAFQTMDLWSVNGLAFFACRRLIRNVRDLRPLAIAGLIAAAIASGSIQERIDQWGNYGRPSIGNDNTNYTAYCIAGLTLIHCLWYLIERRSAFTKSVFTCGLLPYAYCLVALGSRGALVAFGCVVCVTCLPFVVSVSVYRAAAVALLAGAILMSIGCFDGVLHKAGEVAPGLRRVSQSDESLSGREDIWPDVRAIFVRQMWFGVGPGNTGLVSRRGVGAHNLLLSVAVEGGIIAIVSFGLLFGLLFRTIGPVCIGRRRVSVLFLFMVYWVPIAFSGHWELAYLGWIVLAGVWQVGLACRREHRLDEGVPGMRWKFRSGRYDGLLP